MSMAPESMFECAYREYRPALIAFVRRRTGDAAEVADIVQEAYLRLLRYQDGYALTALKGLLFQITIRLLSERARKIRTRQLMDHVPFEDQLPANWNPPSHDRQLAGEQDLRLLVSAIYTLPRRCQQVFVLRRFHGFSTREISRRLGISMGTVERHVSNALSRCRRKVNNTPGIGWRVDGWPTQSSR